MSEPENCEKLLRHWLARTVRTLELHYKAAHKANRKNYAVGAVGIVGGIAVALNSLYCGELKTIVPVVGGVAAALATAFQLVFQWKNQAEAHKAAAIQMGQIRRTIEYDLAFPEALNHQPAEIIREQINLVLPAAPRIPFDFYEEGSD